jgi:hypothetical protein
MMRVLSKKLSRPAIVQSLKAIKSGMIRHKYKTLGLTALSGAAFYYYANKPKGSKSQLKALNTRIEEFEKRCDTIKKEMEAIKKSLHAEQKQLPFCVKKALHACGIFYAEGESEDALSDDDESSPDTTSFGTIIGIFKINAALCSKPAHAVVGTEVVTLLALSEELAGKLELYLKNNVQDNQEVDAFETLLKKHNAQAKTVERLFGEKEKQLKQEAGLV